MDVYKGGPLCFWPDGQCVVSKDHGRLAFWSTATGDKRGYLKGHDSLGAFSIASDGHVAMVPGNTSILLMDIRHRGYVQDKSRSTKKQKRHALRWALRSFGRRLCSSSHQNDGRPLYGIPQKLKHQIQNNWSSIEISPDGQTFATRANDGTIHLCSAFTGEWKTTLDVQCRNSHMRFSRYGHFLVTHTDDSMARVWDTTSGDCKLLIHMSTGLSGLDFSPDGSTLALPLGNGKVGIWDLSDFTCEQYLDHKNGKPINDRIVFSLDSQLLGVHTDRMIHLWKRTPGTHKFASVFSIGHFREDGFAISPDGKLLVIYTWRKGIEVWEIATKTCKCAFNNIRMFTYSFAISPDSHTLALSTDSMLMLFDLEKGTLKETFENKTDICLDSYSSDGRYIHTNRGALSVNHEPSRAFDSKGKQQPLLYFGHDWIFNHGKRVLWIPPEYRSGSLVIRGFSDVLLRWNDRLVLIILDFA